ncbi:uncharacterized protein N7469_009063 [Penicillium citrinum]|uniref:ATP-grasp domain-containing protein n=1 Tax=Penicillium citrinum TaxID=5077 RepID=A0A9W9NN76_PENCI|nr:uncharacterized protein N7469_009063 [Penicillium citrinum]KAJ5222823.1 hypothetical protein N7469_009063 [Penicillium citrinum]
MGEAQKSSLNIALISEQRSAYLDSGFSEEQCAALTHDGEIEAVLTALQHLGYSVTLVPGIQSLVQLLAVGGYKDWDLVFNMAQGFFGPARESQVPALLEAYRIPFTFSDAATMALCQNKSFTKITLDRHHIPNASFAVIHPSEGVADTSKFEKALPPYPLFVKLATEGSSKGIEKDNKVNGLAELKPAIQKLRHQFPDQDILVESFLSGREFTVSIMGTGAQSRVIGIREHIWQENSIDGTNNDYHSDPMPNFACRLNKSNRSNKMLIYNDSHDMDEPQIKATCQVALDAWKVLNCRDCGRVDIRFDSDKPGSSPNVLEVGIRSYLYHIKRRKLIFVFYRSILLLGCSQSIRRYQLRRKAGECLSKNSSQKL